ncbi:Peptide-methionine (S)-S-oxide reductase [Hanseniaspora osmophila]|uniref:peptide-methionine (S)-S-oxide reductase n=1 Tax=Hanseniaspora osmophila TaxID=56408 RepID=A0A1E5R2P9_9ASCO|nr:Peptide methionine sulfoxide reductase [Hanseniaspora osmophila]
MSTTVSRTIKYNSANNKLVTVAAGCFWGVDHLYRKHFGDRIVDCTVGFANGSEDKKDTDDSISYKTVCSGTTDFAEALQISYDPQAVSFKELIDFFFRMHDPTTTNSQGPDVGTQYRSGIFTHSDEDLKEALKLKEEWQPKWKNKIVTEVEPIKNYYDADEFHQKYLFKNPEGYACPAHYVRNF